MPALKTNLLLILISAVLPTICLAQGAGMGAGAAMNAYSRQPTVALSSNDANYSDLIAVSGTAAIAIKPEALRLVLAVTSEAATANECAQTIRATISDIRTDLNKIDLRDPQVVEDFIVVLPVYKWELEGFEKTSVAREKPNGFRMQSNLHILCTGESQAMKAIDVAFAKGVSEIVSFDYWHSDLDGFKQEAMKKALHAAKTKSEILLSIFDDKPKILNINNSIKISTPATQYRTLTPIPSDAYVMPYNWNNFPKIKAHRPLTTFYAGSQEYADITPDHPPMHPEILVHSTVTVTYESPARKERIEIDRLKATHIANDKSDK